MEKSCHGDIEVSGHNMVTPISDILDKLDTVTQTYTFNGYAALVNSTHTPMTLAITAYIAFIGWMTVQGWGQLTVGQTVKHTLKIAIAYTLATEWGYFSEFIYNVLTNGPNELSTILMQASSSSSSSVNAALQDAFTQGMSIGDKIWHRGGVLTAPSFLLAAMIIWLLNFLVCGIALLELVVAKCGLAVTLVLAPVFVLFLLWNSTKGLFEKWFSVALGFGLVPLFLTAVLLMVDQLMQMGLDTIEKADKNSATETIECISTFVLGSVASVGLLQRAASIAAHVASKFSISKFGSSISSLQVLGLNQSSENSWLERANTAVMKAKLEEKISKIKASLEEFKKKIPDSGRRPKNEGKWKQFRNQ